MNAVLEDKNDHVMEKKPSNSFNKQESIIKLKSILNIIGCENNFYDNISTSTTISTPIIKTINNPNFKIENKLTELKDFYLPKIILILHNSKDKGYNQSNFYFHKYNFNWKFNNDNYEENEIYFHNIRLFLHYLKNNKFIHNNISFKVIDKNNNLFNQKSNINILFLNILNS